METGLNIGLSPRLYLFIYFGRFGISESQDRAFEGLFLNLVNGSEEDKPSNLNLNLTLKGGGRKNCGE